MNLATSRLLLNLPKRPYPTISAHAIAFKPVGSIPTPRHPIFFPIASSPNQRPGRIPPPRAARRIPSRAAVTRRSCRCSLVSRAQPTPQKSRTAAPSQPVTVRAHPSFWLQEKLLLPWLQLCCRLVPALGHRDSSGAGPQLPRTMVAGTMARWLKLSPSPVVTSLPPVAAFLRLRDAPPPAPPLRLKLFMSQVVAS